MDARVSLSGWSPIDRLRRSAVVRLFAVASLQLALDERRRK
ncbi:MAG TPA: hypothetical protein VHC91_08650 [Trinickia sp.]|nr:hypothetical protein [Trinickia sp.]HVW50464.1 hypothetical protein [Trinickia sp.]